MNKQMEMIDILQEECRKDSELLDMIIEEYVMGLNAFEEANLEDFIVNKLLHLSLPMQMYSFGMKVTEIKCL